MAAQPYAGTKRDFVDGPNTPEHDRRDRPRDWRDAHLDDNELSRTRVRDRDRDHRDRDRDRDRERERDRERQRERSHRHHDRDREREDQARDSRSRDYQSSRDKDYDRRRYGNDDRRSRGYDDYRERDRERERGERSSYHARHGDGDRSRHDSRMDGREEGEIDDSSQPARSVSPRRPSDPSPRRPRERARETTRSPTRPGSFQAIKVPAEQSRSDRRPSGQLASRSPAKPAPSAHAEEPEPEEEMDEEKRIAERRRKREALLARFRVGEGAKPRLPSSPSKDHATPGSGAESVVSNGLRSGVESETGATPLVKLLGTRSVTAGLVTPGGTGTPGGVGTPGAEPSLANTPMGKDFDLEKHGSDGRVSTETREGVSAADYDPARESADNEKRRKEFDATHPGAVAAQDEPKEAPAAPAEEEWEEVEIEVEEEDDDMDMFAAFGDEEIVKKKRLVKVRRLKNANGTSAPIEQIIPKPKPQTAAVLEVVDNVDDTEGYYRITPGEILDDGRYKVTVTLGKGMFSAVVKATVLKAVGQERRQDVVGKEVAIKLMRSQESMYVAGRKEAQILKLLNDADPDDRKHIVRLDRTFEHKGHLAIVTESMSMNLRDVIKRFGKDVGLNMKAVRAYAHQMFLSLSLMRKCNIVHADIKPDNVLVSENKAVLKVCDLGTAAEVTEGEVTPYLVSRFYRAPEIILGLPYDFAIDMWAVGCTLYELFTGKILFPGRSNNHMLLLMMDVKGKIPVRMIRRATLDTHFDESNNFISIERDRITGADVIKTLTIAKATRDLRSRLMPPSSVQVKMNADELKQLQQFVDLLEKCLMLDPVRRISPREALIHPFFGER